MITQVAVGYICTQNYRKATEKADIKAKIEIELSLKNFLYRKSIKVTTGN